MNNTIINENICLKVKNSSNHVYNNASNVKINENNLNDFICKLEKLKYPKWSDSHNIDIDIIDIEELILFVLSIDSVNFCFWPYESINKDEYEYDNLVKGFRDQLSIYSTANNVGFYTSKNLINLKIQNLIDLNIFPKYFPLLDERTRSLNELGYFVKYILKDKPSNLLNLANNNCLDIAELLIKEISTFRDESFYKGKQVFLYKRAQIASADLYSSLKEKNINLINSDKLTMFPDYRVPQILNELEILEYNKNLKEKINNKEIINANSEQEIEIRLITVYVVELIKKALLNKNINLKSIEIDYMLWNEGEKLRNSIVNHHRTLTIFY